MRFDAITEKLVNRETQKMKKKKKKRAEIGLKLKGS